MSAASKYLDKKFLKSLEPLNRLTTDKLDEIISKSTVDNLPAGRVLFRQGERDGNVIYLLSGTLELHRAGTSRPELLKARTGGIQQPIIDQQPRPCTAKTKTATSILTIDASLLEILLDENVSGEYEVTEIGMADDSTDWMMRFLQSRAFLSMPTENIQNLLMRMEEVSVKAGQVVIKQGAEGDYYYVVNQGECVITRRPAPAAEEIKLAELGIGSGFGEEALITDGKRNATVTMLTDGVLMRLSKADFLSILVEPLQQKVRLDDVIRNKKPTATVIDLRSKQEFDQQTLPGAINIPLSMLRLKLPTLDLNREYLSYSDNSKDSAAAAFLLNQNGVDCRIIAGSFTAPVKQTTAKAESIPPQSKKQSTPRQNPPAATSNVERLREAANKIHLQADQLVSKTDHHHDKKLSDKPAASAAPATPVKQPDPLQAARHESEKILAEANRIRQAALQEASRLRQAISSNASSLQAKETARLKQKLDEARNKAEKEIKNSTLQAELLRKQAEQERAQILQQARLEAEQLRDEIQSLRAKADQEQQEIKQQLKSEVSAARLKAIEEARLRAEKAAEEESRQLIEQARLEAEKAAEAESRRLIEQARQEAEQLKSEIQALRNKAEQEQSHIKLQIEQEITSIKQRAADEARQRAEQEAANESKQIIEHAKLEAEKLKAEIKALKNKAEQEQFEIQKKIEQEIDEIRQRAADEARLQAAKEAEEIKKNALAEAQQVKEALQHTKTLLEKQVAETKPKSVISHENVFDLDDAPAVVSTRKFTADEESAKQMAIEIKKRLAETEQKRQAAEVKHKKTKSTVRKLKDKIILESDTDIFVFKYPKADEKPAETRAPVASQAADVQPDNATSATSNVINLDQAQSTAKPAADNNRQSNKFNLELNPVHEATRYSDASGKKKGLFAVAAGVILLVAAAATAYNYRNQVNFTEVLALVKTTQPAVPDSIEGAEEKVRDEAEAEFKRKIAGRK
ncbi:MAG: cyclic nucleotide-binding domain-containing protein [Gammaproteobacteria bacterium]|nr:cyclic nucleotide-binding domain-containing protein [Gammaproteobacteria bacterium]MDH5651570.1 cyclic nucleotide-binding domain-containing protein [Gammaproteobacteria bacterium]